MTSRGSNCRPPSLVASLALTSFRSQHSNELALNELPVCLASVSWCPGWDDIEPQAPDCYPAVVYSSCAKVLAKPAERQLVDSVDPKDVSSISSQATITRHRRIFEPAGQNYTSIRQPRHVSCAERRRNVAQVRRESPIKRGLLRAAKLLRCSATDF